MIACLPILPQTISATIRLQIYATFWFRKIFMQKKLFTVNHADYSHKSRVIRDNFFNLCYFFTR